MNDEYKLTSHDGETLSHLNELVLSLYGQALLLFDNYHLVNRTHEKFITLNGDFIVELFSDYHIVFWSGNAIVFSIDGTASKVKPKLDFEGTEDDLNVLANVVDKLLTEIGDKYEAESRTVQKKSFEVISALVQKYRDQD
ncbi:MAG: hypothetical protein DI539_13165 [Flavobacterium psychrophilum]|nr:MAG: hypothetical protein DI539_13165 [Flavobacterium psychrophilum]